MNITYPSFNRREIPTLSILNQLMPGYSILNRIGIGKAGGVYTAIQESFNRKVAIKVIPRRIVEETSTEQAFMESVKKMASTSSPYLSQLYEVGETEQFYFVILEFNQGCNLNDILFCRMFDIMQTIELVSSLNAALHTLHENDLVHTAVNPRNISFSTGELKLSHAEILQSAKLPTDIKSLNDSLYSAPETLLGGKIDQRADIYSVGVLMMKCLTGLFPNEFNETTESRHHLMGELSPIIMNCIQLEANDRYPSILSLSKISAISKRPSSIN